MKFLDPWWFAAAIVIVPMLVRYRKGRKRHGYLVPSSLVGVRTSSHWRLLTHGGFVLRALALLCLTGAMARPVLIRDEDKRKTEGIDIVLAIDTSDSMNAMDFELDGQRVNRLDVTKKVVRDFIEKRGDDRIGIVVFGDHAFTQAPLTLDHTIVLQFLDRLFVGSAGQTTAIGEAIATATKRLKNQKGKSRVAILLTDGKNTSGSIDPLVAAEAAKRLGIKIYTIGVGSDREVPYPERTPFGIRYRPVRFEMDEALLKDIAGRTGASFFLAEDTASLVKIYDTIDKLEKGEIVINEYREVREAYRGFVWAGLMLLAAELAFGLTRFRSLPV